MKDKLPDYVLEKCKIYINGHVIIIRFIKCRERPFYTVYYSVDKRFKGKSKDWIDNNFPPVPNGYSFPPSSLVGCDPKLTFVGWDYYQYGDTNEDYSIDSIKEYAILILEQYINMFEEGER